MEVEGVGRGTPAGAGNMQALSGSIFFENPQARTIFFELIKELKKNLL